MATSVTPAGSGTATGSTANTSTTGSQPVTESEFLQLLVAQLQNQDPLDTPTDPTQFVTELAQFEQLEQSTNMSQNVASILQDVNQLVSGNQTSGTSATGNTQP